MSYIVSCRVLSWNNIPTVRSTHFAKNLWVKPRGLARDADVEASRQPESIM